MPEFVSEDGITYSSYEEYVLIGLLGFCGCVDDAIERDIVTVLKTYSSATDPVYYDRILAEEDNRAYVECILHLLTRANILEHGVAVRGSWLTDRGKEVCARLEE